METAPVGFGAIRSCGADGKEGRAPSVASFGRTSRNRRVTSISTAMPNISGSAPASAAEVAVVLDCGSKEEIAVVGATPPVKLEGNRGFKPVLG
mmetsp:Transcript_17976/g.20237  ORF Transcript_17976/g.20237 Transcript_17976/m.20237 type:complete len:94 (-) Transcript_17976:80-361(-)